MQFMASTDVLIGRSENVHVVYAHMLYSTLFISSAVFEENVEVLS